MKTVILAGGFGSRLQNSSEPIIKPLVEIGNVPLICHVMRIYARCGFTKFIIAGGYKVRDIRNYFLTAGYSESDLTMKVGNPSSIVTHRPSEMKNWEVTIVDTGLMTQTGARVKRLQRFLDEDDFMLTYADGIGDIDIQDLVGFHMMHGRIGTVTGVRPSSRYGELVINGDEVVEFCEKLRPDRYRSSGGFFVFKRKFLEYLTTDISCNLEQDPLRTLARDGQLMCYPHDGSWMCVDTNRDLARLEELWRSGKLAWLNDGGGRARL